MYLTYFTEEFLAKVRSVAASEHALRYASEKPWVLSLPDMNSGIRESQVEVDGLPQLICSSASRTEGDAANAIALYEHLKSLTPVQAADERLWACLSHTHYWDYMRTRWASAVYAGFDSIQERWFFRGSGMERLARNGIARLWWGAYASLDPGADDPYWLTRILFSNMDIQQAYMERLFGKSRHILRAALKFIAENQSRIRKRQTLGQWARESAKLLNRLGGVLQLDALAPHEVEEVLETHLQVLFRAGSGPQ